MDMANNVEPAYNDVQGLYRRWNRAHDTGLWDEQDAFKEARAFAAHLAEYFEATGQVRGKYGPKDFDNAAGEMVEEWKGEHRLGMGAAGDPKAYELADVEERNRKAPDRFLIESAAQRRSLFVGDLAKLIFLPVGGKTGERMWVKILEPIRPGRYYGELLNDPIMIPELSRGAKVEFGPEHIAVLEKAPRGGLFEPGLR